MYRNIALRTALLCAASALAFTVSAAAQTVGGAGGRGGGAGGAGGFGDSALTGGAGGGSGSASSAPPGGGGGGGGGSGGSPGGLGGAPLDNTLGGPGGVGGAGGASVQANAATINGLFGGVNGVNGSPGSGGAVSFGGGGGGGGAGAYGLLVVGGAASVTVNSTGLLFGGDGGAGGAGGDASAAGGDGGSGGGGGGAIFYAAGGGTLTNAGIVTGGAGGLAGAGGAAAGGGIAGASGAAGLGGVAVEGADLIVVNSGAIRGGLAGDGVTRANAISFTGGASTLTTNAGGSYSGAIDIAGDAVLTLEQSAATATYGAGQFTGNGSLQISTANGFAVAFSGSSPGYTGVTTVLPNGQVIIGANTSFGSLNLLSGSSVTLGNVSSLGSVALIGDSTFNVSGSASTGGIHGSGGVVVLGTGGGSGVDQLTLAAANDYTGATNIGDGAAATGVTLKAGGANVFSQASPTTVNAHSALDLGGFAQSIDNVSLAGGAIQNGSLIASLSSTGGAIAARLTGASALTVTAGATTLTGANDYSGATFVANGTLAAGASGAFSVNSATTVAAGGVLSLGATTQSIASLALQGGVILGGRLTAGVTSTGGLIGSQLTGASALTAAGGVTTLTSGANDYTGATSITNGALTVASGGRFSAASQTTIGAGGALDLNQLAQQIDNLALNGGALRNGPLAGAVASQGGSVENVTGTAALSTLAGSDTTLSGVNQFSAIAVAAGSNLVAPGAATLTLGAGGLNNAGNLNVAQSVLRADGPAPAGFRTDNILTLNGAYNGAAGSQITIAVSTNGTANSAPQVSQIVVNGAATGNSTLNVSLPASGGAPGVQTVFLSQPQTFLTTQGGNLALSPNVLVNGAPQNPRQLLNYVWLHPGGDANKFALFDAVNGSALGGVVGGVAAGVGAAQAGFFQGSIAFIASPPNQNPNAVSAGVWTRDAAGVNIEKAAVEASGGGATLTTPLSTISHFSGAQVGSDFAIFNMGGSGWNFHTGLTGGEYVSSSSGPNDYSSFKTPFLGAYAALTGHGVSASVLVRHDDWYGHINSPDLAIANARMNGSANAVTAELAYQIDFSNGLFLKPSAGFSYNRAAFDQVSGGGAAPGAPDYKLTVGPVVSKLGVISVQGGYPFRAGEWALIPLLTGSVWHEFADAIPGRLTSNGGAAGQSFDFALQTSRVGTFGQVGVGIAASPLQLPNLLMYLRADYRSGENIAGGTFTYGARYSF